MKIPKLSSLLGSAVALLAMASLTSTQATPVFSSSTPTGNVQFENSYTSFTAILSDAPTTPITNVTISLSGTRLVGGKKFTRYGMWPGSLTTQSLSNNATSNKAATLTYSSFSGLKLESNVVYSAAITVVDASSASNTFTVTFDTIKPTYYWDACDWDYTQTNSDGTFQLTGTGATNSGQHIEGLPSSPFTKTNAYRGKFASGLDAVTYNTGGAGLYRPQTNYGSGTKSGLATESCGDIPRPPYYNQATNGYTNYDLSYSAGNNFANYTHLFPTAAGSYYVFARMASPNGSQSNSLHFYDQGGSECGWFGNVQTSTSSTWQTYTWVPLLDPTSLQYVPVPTTYWSDPTAPTAQTFTVKYDSAANGLNLNSFIMLPGSITIGSSSAVITNFAPNGLNQFQYSNQLTFTIRGGSVTPANVLVTVVTTNINLARTVTTAVYVGGSSTNLTFTGSPGSYTVSMPLQTNRLYGITVQATDASGNDAVAIDNFDTMLLPAFLWEAEDWDYNAGQWTNGVNAYQDFTNAPNIAITNVDFSGSPSSTSATFAYRYGLETEICPDRAVRSAHTNASGNNTDYDLGYNTAGNWANYTRTFPSYSLGTTNVGYNILARVASGGANSDVGSLYLVTAGVGQDKSQQATLKIGYYGSTAGPDYHTGTWMPVIDPGGNLAIFRGGTTETLRWQFDGNYANINYFMLVPADPNVKNKPYIINFTPDGSVLYQPSNTVTFLVNSQPGITSSGVSINLDGVALSNSVATFGTNQYLLSVSFPIYTNTVHAVIVTVTDVNGSSTTTNRFAAFNSNDCFKVEDEDYNYGGGSFNDFPFVPDSYAKGKVVDAVTNIDYAGGNPNTGWGAALTYRSGIATATASASSDIEVGFPTGTTNFHTGYTTSGMWANYTRTFPQGIYTIFSRSAGNGVGNAIGSMSTVDDPTSATQKATPIGTFEFTTFDGTYSTYSWFKCTNSGNNLAKFVSDGTPTHLRKTSGGSDNPDYFIVAKWNSSIPEAPMISRFTPDSSTLYQPSNAATFLASSIDPTFAASNVKITLDGFPVTSPTYTPFTSLLTNGFTFSFPVTVGRLHTAVVVAWDKNGRLTNTFNFQTFSQTNAYKIELEDFDFNGGGPTNFISFTNWVPDCYTDIVTSNITATATNLTYIRGALTNIDYFRGTNNGGSLTYRIGMASGTTTDMESDEYNTNSSAINYCPSYNDGGDWMNYTRDLPVGNYNVYLRVSSGNGNSPIIQGPQLQVVTNGVGTTNQQTNIVGTFQSFAYPGGWGNYLFTPMADNFGNPLVLQVTNATPTTWRFYENWPTNLQNTLNPDYLVFVPADTATPDITGLYPNGLVQFQGTNNLGFTLSSAAGINSNTISVTINGVAVALTITGNSNSWNVSLPLSLNSNYVAVIQAVAAGGSGLTKTIAFDTYSAGDYTWEAEDFDFTANNNNNPFQFIDNVQFGGYLGLFASEGYDFHFYNNNTDWAWSNVLYRATSTSTLWVSGTWWFPIQYSADTPRTQFTGATTNLSDYDVEDFTPGSWAHYTRHYTPGTYNVLARVRETNGPVPLYLEKVATVVGSGETTTTLGTFFPTNQGGSSTSWQSVFLTDSKGTNLVTVTFDGSATTLRVEASTNTPNPFPANGIGDSIALNYFMLVPTGTAPTLTSPKVTATLNGTTLTLSFPSQSTANYQVQYKASLSATTWTPLGSTLKGTGSTLTATDTVGTGTRFYRVLVTAQ